MNFRTIVLQCNVIGKLFIFIFMSCGKAHFSKTKPNFELAVHILDKALSTFLKRDSYAR